MRLEAGYQLADGEENKSFSEDIEPVSETKQLSKRARVEAGYQLADGEENKSLSEEKAGIDTSYGEENKSPLRVEAGNQSSDGEENKSFSECSSESDSAIDSWFGYIYGSEAEDDDASHGEENNRLLGFSCSECLDFQSDLAISALEYYGKRKNDPTAFEEVRVFAACFLNSWPRMHTTRCKFTDKCHISFTAKPKNHCLDDVSPKWFFAELLETENGDFRPTICEMMNPKDPGITYGCAYCPPEKKFPHPPRSGEHFERRHPPKYYNRQNAATFKHHHRLAEVSGESKRDKIKLKDEQWLSYLDVAATALTYDKMDCLYEVEKVVYLEKMPFSWVEIEGTSIWYHMVFTARPKNTSSSGSSPKCFFGELKVGKDTGELVSTYCCTMETSDSGVTRGCGFCPPDEQFLHPADGYKCGAWVDPPCLEFITPECEVFMCGIERQMEPKTKAS